MPDRVDSEAERLAIRATPRAREKTLPDAVTRRCATLLLLG
jgi:hypothetical protein